MINIKYDNDFLIDLTGCASKPDIHRLLKESLDLSDHYGNNLDALWDELSDRYSSSHPVTVSFIGEDDLSDELMQYLSIIIEIIDRANQR